MKLAAQWDADAVAPLLRGMAKAAPRRTVAAAGPAAAPVEEAGLAERLAALSADERLKTVLDLVCGHAAAVLGYSDAHAVGPEKGFTDLGIDSLAALELRNRLGAATEMRLPATLIFDYPSPLPLARHLLTELVGQDDEPAADVPEQAPAAQEIAAIAGMDLADLVRTALGGNTVTDERGELQ